MGRPAIFPLMAAALGATYNLAGRSADAMLLLAPALEQAMASEVVVNQATALAVGTSAASRCLRTPGQRSWPGRRPQADRTSDSVCPCHRTSSARGRGS